MKKKITAGLLALTLALSLAGCGDDKAAPDEAAGTESAGGTESAALNEETKASGEA